MHVSLYVHCRSLARSVVIERDLCFPFLIQFYMWIPVQCPSVINFSGNNFTVVLWMIIVNDFGIAVNVGGAQAFR